MTLSPTALESAAVAALVEMDDRGLLKEVGDDLFDEIKNAVATAAITAYLAQAGKEGRVMVPKEPTGAMVEAGAEVMYGRYRCSFEVTPIYTEMLAAAQNGGK